MADYNLLLVENVLIKDIFIEPVNYQVGVGGGELTKKTESNRFFSAGIRLFATRFSKPINFSLWNKRGRVFERPRRTRRAQMVLFL